MSTKEKETSMLKTLLYTEPLSSIHRFNPRKEAKSELDSQTLNRFAMKRMGAEQYYMWYQSWDKLASTPEREIVIDIDAIIADVKMYFGDQKPHGYGMLDYEAQFFENIHKGVDDPEHQKTVSTMVDALLVLKKEFPGMKWTYYGVPTIPYWISDPLTNKTHPWKNAPDELQNIVTKIALQNFEELISHCDWVSPSNYNRYDPDAVSVNTSELMDRERVYRAKQMEVCRILAGDKEIIAMIHPYYAPGGKAEYSEKLVQDRVMIEATLKPYLENGATGIAIWTANFYYCQTAFPKTEKTKPNEIRTEAFVRNYKIDEEVPFMFGSASEEERQEWRNRYIELASKTVLRIMKNTRWIMDKLNEPREPENISV